MHVIDATREYETWLRRHTTVVEEDLTLKHERMAEAAFPFMRATFYRWVQLWHEHCHDLTTAPSLLAVGDLHIDNFGTWRDAEGRLVWGINDFDEACLMPYAIDLVRLATSAILAGEELGLAIGGAEACATIMSGYVEAIRDGTKPFVLEENEAALRQMALGSERDPARFWGKIEKLRKCRSVPGKVRKLLVKHLPTPTPAFRTVHRVAGLGSLGRQRYVAVAEWHGSMIAREAKALLPSAYHWARDENSEAIQYRAMLGRALRCPDPYIDVAGAWLIRRIGPRCSRIELTQIPKARNEAVILRAMGRETANVHFGTPQAIPAIKTDLRRRKGDWLHAAAMSMAAATKHDWEAWRKRARK